MDRKEISEKLEALAREMSSSPTAKSSKYEKIPRGKVAASKSKVKTDVRSLSDSLDYLRVCVKYLLFDLEATRRENDYLKRMMDEEG